MISVDDVQHFFRVLSSTTTLAGSPLQTQRLVLGELCRRCDADCGFFALLEHDRRQMTGVRTLQCWPQPQTGDPGSPPWWKIARECPAAARLCQELLESTYADPVARASVPAQPTDAADPYTDHLAGLDRPLHSRTARRNELCPPTASTSTASSNGSVISVLAGQAVREAITSVCIDPQSAFAPMSLMAICRLHDDRPFDSGRLALVDVIHRELLRTQSLPAQPLRNLLRTIPERERETLRLLLTAASEKQIARHFNASPHTIHAYVKRIYKTFGVNSRPALMALFIAHNAADPPDVARSPLEELDAVE